MDASSTVGPFLLSEGGATLLAAALGFAAVLGGALTTSIVQSRITGRQSEHAHRSQMEALQQSHEQNLEVLKLREGREEDLRRRQCEECDTADRLLIIEYVDYLMARLVEICSISYIGSDNRDDNELAVFLRVQTYMGIQEVDPVRPQRNHGLRIAFQMFQLLAAMRNALNARWTRPLSDEQVLFLSHWESHMEPIMCSGGYPGKELLYRDQMEILTDAMLVLSPETGVVSPMNWRQFCEAYKSDEVMRELAEVVASKIRFIFDEENSLPPRKAMQCRLAIFALYLIQVSNHADSPARWGRYEDSLWSVIDDFFEWECGHGTRDGSQPTWYVFEYGDVAERRTRRRERELPLAAGDKT